jgi:hypothetical protein
VALVTQRSKLRSCQALQQSLWCVPNLECARYSGARLLTFLIIGSTRQVNQPVFASFMQGGFECSTHRLPNGRRLDLVSASRHGEFAVKDFISLQPYGIRTVREGIRWHKIEAVPGQYDFSSVLEILSAANETGTEVIWDLLHFGWPDHIDVFSREFPVRFGELAGEFSRFLRTQTGDVLFIAPVNEISFVSWGGGDQGFLNPFAENRGPELKRQLVSAAIVATKAVWSVTKSVRLVSPEPVIHIVGNPLVPGDAEAAERYRCSMFEAWDMLSGRLHPELGGKPEYLDVIGMNFYDRNQWINHGRTLERTDSEYRPFREIVNEVYQRYQRPVFVAETGAEDDERPGWFTYVAGELLAAMRQGVPVEGLCLYPIVNHPGWNDDRHCYNGLLDYANDRGERAVYEPLAQEILKANEAFQAELQRDSL